MIIGSDAPRCSQHTHGQGHGQGYYRIAACLQQARGHSAWLQRGQGQVAWLELGVEGQAAWLQGQMNKEIRLRSGAERLLA